MRQLLFIIVLIITVPTFPLPTVFGQTDQEVHVSGSPNPVGSGARALGMGGAFIGVADDATAASWNPGGLIQLERPEVSLVVSYEKLSEDRSFRQNPGASGNYHLSLTDINYLSAAYPFTINDVNMVFSLNYQTLYNFNKLHDYDYTYQNNVHSSISIPGPPISIVIDINQNEVSQRETYQSHDGYLKALSPAMAFQWTPRFSVGISMNYLHPDLGSKWDETYTDRRKGFQYETINRTINGIPLPTENNTYSIDARSHYISEYTFKTSLNPFEPDKISFNLGFMWDINSFFTLGGVYKSGYTADVHFKEAYEREHHIINIADPGDATHSATPWTVVTDEDQEMVMPASYGLGLAWRFSDQFTMDLDVYRTDWQDFVLRQADGRELSVITGQERSLADTKPTHQVRLGGEYLYLYKYKYAVPVRAGVFYDPEPTEDSPDDFYGFSLGTGVATNKFAFDIAYQFRWGNGVRKVRLGSEEIFQDVQQHTIYASIIYYF